MQSDMKIHKTTRQPAWTHGEENNLMEAYRHYIHCKLFQDALPKGSRRQIQSHGPCLIREEKLLKKYSRPWQRQKTCAEANGGVDLDGNVEVHAEGEGEADMNAGIDPDAEADVDVTRGGLYSSWCIM